LETSEDTVSEQSPKLDKTFALTDFQIEEVAAEQTDNQVQDTIQAEQPYDSEILADAGDEYFSATVSAAQLAKDIGGGSPTPVAAQTVFTATSSQPGNQVLQWSVFAVLCLVIAASLSLFVFNYTIPVERSIKSPLVARGIETQPEPVPTIEIPEEIVSSVDVDSSLFTGEITDVIEKENEMVVEEGQKESEAADTQFALAQEGMEQEKVWYPSEDDSTGDDAVAVVVETVAATLPEKIILEQRLIKISRSKSVDKHGVLINEAFQEYLAGDYDSAEVSYQSVLKELPENRDALLGLAAISSRKGQLRQAYNNYLEILKLYPGDSVAEAALINFQRNGDYARNESILKTFIQREPDNSFLYYSLGRHYAAQTRWPEAQLSFFNAYRIETSNPDYAFNLAVSLDHIGQQLSAIDYYNVALELANQSNGGPASISFDRTVVISRINTLSNPAN
jgi:tetratricopeptide (TPR) repeat protein